MNLVTHLRTLVLAAALAPLAVLADTVTLKDGSVVNGVITRIEGGSIHLTTSFAGSIAIAQAQVQAFTTSNPLFVKTEDGATAFGQVSATDAGIRITGTQSQTETSVGAVRSSWGIGGEDPEVAALRRNWAFEVALDITGRDGNSDRFGTAFGFNATLKGPEDTLRFYGDYRFAEENGTTSEDALRGGVDYAAFFSKRLSWFVNAELGRDDVKDLELRARAAAGLGYSAIRSDKQNLTLRAGLGYRYETYRNDPTDALRVNSPGLELGLLHDYTFSYGTLNNSLLYVPAFEDLGNFILVHDSSLTMPVGAGDFWLLRVGINNEYTSEPGPGREELDTLYYVRLILAWK